MATSILAERSKLARHHVRELEKARKAAQDTCHMAYQAIGTARCPAALELRDLCRLAIRDLRRVEAAARRVATAERLVTQARRWA